MFVKANTFSFNVLNEIIFNYRYKVLKWKQHVETYALIKKGSTGV